MNVQFTASSVNPVDSWDWDFGDGNSATIQNPFHTYTSPGAFDVRLDVTSGTEQSFRLKNSFVIALADTIIESSVESYPNTQIVVTIDATNNIPLDEIILPIKFNGDITLTFDSISTVGCRADYFELVDFIQFDAWNKKMALRLQTTLTDTQPDLSVGSGPILKVYFYMESPALATDTTFLNLDGYTNGSNSYLPTFSGPLLEYQPNLVHGIVTLPQTCCIGIAGNIDNDPLDNIDISDLVILVSFMFQGGAEPACLAEANIDGSILEPVVDISDIVLLVSYMFQSGLPPATCQ